MSVDPKLVRNDGRSDDLTEYEVTVNGQPLTLQLDDDDAVRWGVKEAEPQAKKPVETQAKKTPAKR